MKIFLLFAFAVLAATSKGEESANYDEVIDLVDCNDSDCNNDCIKLGQGWNGGRCIRGVCYCWGISDTSEEIVTAPLIRSEPIEKPEETAGLLRANCEPGACTSGCSNFGWSGGRCTGGKCTCFSRTGRTQRLLSEFLAYGEGSSAADCDQSACARGCRSFGWAGGLCTGGRCECFQKRDLADVFRKFLRELRTTNAEEHMSPVTACEVGPCNKACLDKGWSGGLCMAEQCYCWLPGNGQSRLRLRSLVKVLSEDDILPNLSAACDDGSCDRTCKKQNWSGGRCKNGKCWCEGRTARSKLQTFSGIIPMAIAETQGVKMEPCPACKNQSSHACAEGCRKKGWKGGVCIVEECWCWKTDDAGTPDIEIICPEGEKPTSESENSLDEQAACNDASCDRSCKKQNWAGGKCRNGTCWCQGRPRPGLKSIFSKTPATSSGSLTDPKKPCPACKNNVPACNKGCRDNGWEGGACVAGDCFCFRRSPSGKPEFLERCPSF